MEHPKRTILFHATENDSFAGFDQLAKAWGFEVLVARNLFELKDGLATGDVDLVVVDPRSEAGRKLFDSLGGENSTRLAEAEKEHILRVLAATRGNKSKAARWLDVDTKTLYNKLRQYEQGVVGRRARGLAAKGVDQAGAGETG